MLAANPNRSPEELPQCERIAARLSFVVPAGAAIGDVAHPAWRASAVGVYRLWRDLGYAAGAVLAGVTADALGLRPAIALVAAITGASGVVVAVRMRETRKTVVKPPTDEAGECLPAADLRERRTRGELVVVVDVLAGAPEPDDRLFRSCRLARMSDRLVFATKKGTLIFDRKSGKDGRWTPRAICHPGIAVSYAAADPRDGTLWACMDNAHWGPALMRSKDGGATWEDASRIVYPQGARYIEQLIPDPKAMEDAGKPITYKQAALMKVWVLGFAGKDQPGVIHAGTLPGGLFTTRDGGETWELNRPLWNHPSRGGDLFAGEATSKNEWGGTPAAMAYGDFVPGIHSVAVDPRDSNHFYVAVSSAGVVETRDGGKSWSGRNKGMLNDYLPQGEADWGHDPHFICLCPAEPDRIWQQNHCGVFTSENGAAQWKRVSQPDVAVHFGFPIAADAKDGKTAWVVPLRSDQERMSINSGLCVARTSDGGASWQSFREGLPQEHTYDVIYRHALDVSGDRLCFGTTTGNAYVSEDRGETWRCLGNNLPPIHSVRFA